jgi:hypothetical protein
MTRCVHSNPRYYRHKASGQAVVTISGKDFYLGLWKSKASFVGYDRVIAEWLAAGRSNQVRSQTFRCTQFIGERCLECTQHIAHRR